MADINRTTNSMALPSDISGEILQKTQQESAIMRLARRIELPGRGVTIPVITGDPTAAWVAETGVKPVSNGTPGTKLMQAFKIAVIERHKNTHHIGIGYIKGYGLKSGAVATSISHDSHNIIVVGTNEADIAAAANRVVELNGGIVVWDGGASKGEVQLEIAGIMSEEPLTVVNDKLESAKKAAYALGVSSGVDPFMTLSFMALPVIPTLRLTTRGVFEVANQKYV